MDSDALAARIRSQIGPTVPGKTAGLAPPRVPDHELIMCIGSGSYGEVWLARSVTGAQRAVKIVWRSRFSSDRPYEREFHGIVQFEPISRSHPGVINVLHVGRDDAAGCFYYVMELADPVEPHVESMGELNVERVPGDGPTHDPLPTQLPHPYSPRTLAADLRVRGRMSVADAVALGVQLANALGHLHRHGLVHRDVKPSNVIFIEGQAKLADIGLVAGMDEARSFVGTEGFIPPEGPGSAPADIFSLGRLLYEAATGKDRCDFPMLPIDLDRWPRSEREAMLELNEILARACAADPKNRHANAADLAGDLNLILAGRSVRRAYGMERRLRQATRISIAAGIVVLLAVVLAWFQRQQRNRSEALAARETTLRERAEAAEHEAQQQLYTALLEQARATVLSGELGQRVGALDAVRRAGAISNSAALRGAAVSALALPDLRFEREWPVPSGTTLAELDPAFERIALCRGTGPVEIHSVPEHRLLASLPARADWPAYVGSWSRDGRLFAVKRDDPRTGGRRPILEVWDVAAARCLLLVTNVARSAFSFHPRRSWLIGGTPAATAVTWDVDTGQEITRHVLGGEPEYLKFAPDGEHFAALHLSGQKWMVTLHRADDGAAGASHFFTDVACTFGWHPTAPWIAVGDRGGGVHLMNTQTGETHLMGRHKSLASDTMFSPDGQYLFTGGWDRELICWDVKTRLRAFTIALHSYRMQFRADGRQCAILNLETPRLQLHAVERPTLYREFAEDLGGGRNGAAFSPDGRWLAACGDKRLAVWDLTSDGPGAEVNETAMRRVGFAPHDELFASRIGAGFRWRVEPGTNSEAPAKLDRLDLPNLGQLVSLCMVSNGVVFTSTRGSRLARFEEFATESVAWKSSVDGLNGASPDGRWLGMFRSFTPQLHVHRLPGLERVVTLTNEAPISLFEFSPRGDEVAVATRRGVEFWSTATWQRTRHLANFTAILYSPDVRTFWLSTEYRSAGLYDARTAELLLPLPPGTIPLALSPDGRHLATSVNARRVEVWNLVEVRERLRELGLEWEKRETTHLR